MDPSQFEKHLQMMQDLVQRHATDSFEQTKLLKEQLANAEASSLEQKELLKQEIKSAQDEKAALVATLKQMETRLTSSPPLDANKVRKDKLEKVSENFRKRSHIKVFNPLLKTAKDWVDSSLTEISNALLKLWFR